MELNKRQRAYDYVAILGSAIGWILFKLEAKNFSETMRMPNHNHNYRPMKREINLVDCHLGRQYFSVYPRLSKHYHASLHNKRFTHQLMWDKGVRSSHKSLISNKNEIIKCNLIRLFLEKYSRVIFF